MVISLYRHGATPGNLARRYVGSTDEPLADIGKEQAQEAAKSAPEVELVYRSPMLRCEQTAGLIFPKTDKVVVDGLHETSFGEFEGKTYDELMDRQDYRNWVDGGDPPGGEGREAARERSALAFLWAVRDAESRGLEKIAVVCHGGTIMSIMSTFAVPRGGYFDYLLPNCGHYTVKADGEPLELRILDATVAPNFLLSNR